MALVAGDLAAAAAYAEEGLTIARETGQGLFVAWDAWTMGVIAGVRGDVETLEHALAVLAPFDPPPAWGAVRDGAAAVRGAYLLATGQPADAAAVLETTVDLEAAQIGNMPLVAPFDLAEAHLRAAGAFRSYERVLDQLATGSQQPWALMALDRTRGLGASPAHGDALFERALASCEHHDMVLERARTRVLYGEWLRRQRRRLDARHQLRSALADLEAMGAGQLAARAAADHRRERRDPRRAPRPRAGRRADPARAAGRDPRDGGAHQPRDRAAPLPQPEDDRGAPAMPSTSRSASAAGTSSPTRSEPALHRPAERPVRSPPDRGRTRWSRSRRRSP